MATNEPDEIGVTSSAHHVILLDDDTVELIAADSSVIDLIWVGRAYGKTTLAASITMTILKSAEEIFVEPDYIDYVMLSRWFVGKSCHQNHKKQSSYHMRIRPAMHDRRVNKRKSYLKQLQNATREI